MNPLPEPPYLVVVFVSRRRKNDPAGYAAAATAMEQLAQAQPGYLGIDSVHDPVTGAGITVSYWADDASARAWKSVAEHAEAQRAGRDRWYESYEIHVGTVERCYAFGSGHHRS